MDAIDEGQPLATSEAKASHAIDGGQPLATSEAKASHVTSQYMTSERLIFTASNSEKQVSVEGIIEYGKDASARKIHTRNISNRSSLSLRKNVPDSSLLSNRNAVIEGMANSVINSKGRGANKFGTLQRIFLNPSYSLRRQMMLTFGSVSSLTILLLIIVSIIASIATGNAIKEESTVEVELWVNETLSTTSRLVAEALSPKVMPTGSVQLLVEVAQDRFMGYPTTVDDSLVPFFDAQSQTNVYPLKNHPLPLDWDFSHTPNEMGNVLPHNYAEHVQERWPLFSANPRLSTHTALYTMQGACDPRAKNISALVYYPNCTDANNNISTGGIVTPSPTNEQVYRKASDLSPFLKALFEFQHAKQIGYYFSNSGAGSSMLFPHYELNSKGSYVSIGCDWMKTLNPIDSTIGPIGTDEEIARCHPSGTIVPTREYNPLERAWCRDQALDPSRAHNVGPYVDAWTADKIWLMTAGKAVYDRVTSAFISCIAIDFTIDAINIILEEIKLDELGILTLVRNNDDGTVVTSPKFNFETAGEPTTIDDPMLETGVDREIFDEIKSIFDFSKQRWDPRDARKSYEDALFDTGQNIVSTYPIPSIPDEYNPTYIPEFFAIFSVPKTTGLLLTVDNVSQEIDDSVRYIVILTVTVGVVGLAVIILLIFVTASWFTEPLKWMQDIGDQVVGKFGQELDESIDYERKTSNSCSPKTELSSLAEEFSKMVTRFSGKGTAKRAQIVTDKEIKNSFEFSDDFADLYQSRDDSDFVFTYPRASAASNETEGQAINQRNLGLDTRSSTRSASTSSADVVTDDSRKVHKSALFLWMVGLIVTPFLVTTVIISAVVLWQISNQLPALVEPVENTFLEINDSRRFSATAILAVLASSVVESAARETHLLNRFASWLCVGGMEASESFTEVIELAEECKSAPSGSECEWPSLPCDCAWNDFLARGKADVCTNYTRGESRFLQKVHFEAQSQDTGPDGSRYSTSFPEVATSPNTTAWWDNITVLPNLPEEPVSSKYGTSLDRVKIVSALSAVLIPLYNYDKSNDKSVGMYISFEADGMMSGYRGCDSGFVNYPFWSSTEENGAAALRPEICPLGKYGYDARCRDWYHVGKSKAKAGNGTLHITAPYLFAEGELLGQSITSPLIDPGNENHIGQVLVDFLPGSMLRKLDSDNFKLAQGGFHVVITPESDIIGHDTVIGPGFSLSGDGKAIKDLILADTAFESIVKNMKAGEIGNGTFWGTVEPNGDEIELMHIAYAPVFVTNFHPLNSSDIASGVKKETTLVYSLALIEPVLGIMEPFENDYASHTVDVFIGVLAALVIVSTVLILYIAFRVTASMSEPILQLFDVIKGVNRVSTSNNDDITELSNYKGSCREVDSVYKTMEMLYKVVRFANAAFFSGELEVAYKVLRDALRLFTRLDNNKAVAVTSNNLGNTMLTIYRTMKVNSYEEMCGLSKREVIEKGTAYFAHSIKLGEEAYDQFYDEQGWSEECLVFMQFLANRYFNRAVFFLTTSCDSENRKEAESLGFRDLQITGDMDVEIVDQCQEMGFKINRVERYELMMSRVRGLLALAELGYSTDELFIEDQITDVYQDLKNAMKNATHDLFKDTSITGRKQQLDNELIRYFRQVKNENVNAARVAIRMLVEDDFIFPDVKQEAIKTLLECMDTSDNKTIPKDEDGRIAFELESIVKSLEDGFIQRGQKRGSAIDATGTGSKVKMRSLKIEGAAGFQAENGLKSRRRLSSALKETGRCDTVMELY